MNTGIYKITSPLQKVYIGQSSNLKKRLHNYNTFTNCKTQKKLYASFLEFGVKAHTIEVIETCEEKDLNVRERYWQEFYKCLGAKGLNCKYTAHDEKRAVYGMESRARMSASRTKEKNHMYGKKGELSPFYGRKQSEEVKAKYSLKRKGVPKGAQHKINIGLTQKGGGNHQAKIVIDLETGIFYECVLDAAVAKGINKYTIYDYLSGRRGIVNKTSLKFA